MARCFYSNNNLKDSAGIPTSPPQKRRVHALRGRFRYHQRVPLLVFLLVILTLGSPAAAAPPSAVEVILDVSAGMHRPGVGGAPIHATVREALIAVVAEAPSVGPNLTIGLRLAGGDPSADHIESCSTTIPALPVAVAEPQAWIRVLDELRPHGFRPLISAVVAGLGDLDPTVEDRRVVVVTSGDDQCGRSPNQVVAALAAAERPAELRMVGLGLEQAVVDRFGGVPIRNATTAEELIDALRWAVLDLEDRPRGDGGLALRLIPSVDDEPVAARVHIFDQATGATHPTTVVGESRLDLPAGRYRLVVKPETGGLIEFRDLLVTAGTERAADLDLSPPQLVAIDVGADPVISGAPTWIEIAGIAPPGARVQFVYASGAAVDPSIEPSPGGVWLDSPAVVGSLELLLLSPPADGPNRVIARLPVTVVSGDPGLTAPDEIGIGEDLAVAWSALAGDGGLIGMVPRDGAPTHLIECIPVAGRTEGRLTAPAAAAELDLVFVNSVTLAATARHPLQVTAPEVTVEAPPRVATGETIEVTWMGPEGAEDFVSLAVVGSPDLEYLEWARVEDGNPSVLPAPRTPGDYELRYVDGDKGEVRARAALEVAAVPIDLAGPATATAGRRFEVVWTGPASPGDFISISKPDAPPDRYLEWTSIIEGSPLTLAAPSKPGAYEIRYVAANGGEVLARTPIEIRP